MRHLLLALGSVSPALAAKIRVNTDIPDINPDGQCSLIEAIINANDDAATHPDCRAGRENDTIRLRNRIHTLTSPYAGENGLPVVTSAISIDGNGATIEWKEGTPPFTVFEVANSGDLTIDETAIVGNYSYSEVPYSAGAGILNESLKQSPSGPRPITAWAISTTASARSSVPSNTTARL